MALFKILSNMETGSQNLPNAYHQGYCYFDITTGKFWVDIDEEALGEGHENKRIALNAYKADRADQATNANVATMATNAAKADKTISIPTGQVDSTSTATAFTATISGITELYDGVCVMLTNGVVTSASGCTLNINGLGAKPIYNTMAETTAVTTTFAKAYTMLFIYNSTRVTGGCWDMYYGYNANTNTLLRTYASSSTNELPIVGVSTNTSMAVPSHTSSYKDLYGGFPNTVANRPVIKMSTGELRAPAGLAAGTAGSKLGKLTLYNNTNNYTTIIQPTSVSANRTITFPNATGTVALTSDIPTNISYFVNDSQYLTEETDPTVPAWAKESTKPTYSLSEINNADDIKAIEALESVSGLLRKTAANTWTLDTTNYLSQHQDITGKADKSTTVTNVAWDSTNNKLTKTINNSTTDVVTAATLKTAMELDNVNNTADLDKPISTATQVALASKADLVSGKVPASQLPSYIDDVLEYASLSNFPITGESGIIYLAVDTNLPYRWSGTQYVEISSSLALGETSSTAYRGDYGKIAYDHASAKGSANALGFYKITTNAEGHVTSTTAVAKSDITALGIPGQDTNTTYTFEDGTNGTFTVTPLGGNTQTISIGKPATAGIADTASAVEWTNINNKPSTFTPSSHAHGNITNDGLINGTAVALASGDRLIFADSSASNKIESSSITIDTTKTTEFLTHAGTWSAISYSNITGTPTLPTSYTGTITAVTNNDTSNAGTSNNYARGDHTHNITGTTITGALGFTPATSTHTHDTTLTTTTDTSIITLIAEGTYKLTAGDTSVVFTMPTIQAPIEVVRLIS